MAGGHTPHHMACLAVQLPTGARTLAAEQPDTIWGLQEVLAAALVNDFRQFMYGMSDKKKRGNPPELIGPSIMTRPKGRSLPARSMTVSKLLDELSKPRRAHA